MTKNELQTSITLPFLVFFLYDQQIKCSFEHFTSYKNKIKYIPPTTGNTNSKPNPNPNPSQIPCVCVYVCGCVCVCVGGCVGTLYEGFVYI